MKFIVSQTLTSFCKHEIRNLILSTKLAPGTRIKTEYLKRYLGVGQSPIREALFSLINTELIGFIDNGGFKVSSLSIEGVSDNYTSLAKINNLMFRESIEHYDDAWKKSILASLKKLKKSYDQQSNDIKAHIIEFHLSLISGCKSAGLISVREHFKLINKWYHQLISTDFSCELATINYLECQKLAELAINKETDEACKILYNHTTSNLDFLISRLQLLKYL